jgi:predicted metal-dependent HD superfamily phosphohydrolase
MDIEQIIKELEQHVVDLFTTNANPSFAYHNLEHTKGVVKATEKIAAHYRLSDEDLLAVYAAAWFHDVGYLFSGSNEHEAAGAAAAAEYLQSKTVSNEVIEKVKGCILATKMPQSPKNLLEEITCDSDLFHLGSEKYKEVSKQMRKEKEQSEGLKISGEEWRYENIKFLESHHYFTTYAQALLKQGKENNIKELKEKQEDKLQKQTAKEAKQATVSGAAAAGETGPTGAKTKEELKKEKENQPVRGIETMFRLTSGNHLDLSGMADSKANIMISVNAIIVSVLLSVLLRRLEEYPNLTIPTVIFLVTCVTTMIFSVLATRPTITTGTFTKDDIRKKRANLLFFGNFYRMKLEDYEWGMMEMMKDRDFLYSSLTRDIYFLGVVLGKKYRLLRIAYNVFMFGFVISVLAFAIAVFFFPDNM